MEKTIFNITFDKVIKNKNIIIHNLKIEDIDFYNYELNINNLKTSLDKKLYNLVKDIAIQEPEMTDDEVFKEIQDTIQNSLNSIAMQKGYDDGFTLASYSESTIEKFRNEALKFIEFRDQCWIICYDFLNKYKNNEIERPILQDILEKLPVFNWDN